MVQGDDKFVNIEQDGLQVTLFSDPANKQNLFYGRFGTAPRTNAIRLPGLVNMDFSANKRFSMGEKRYVEFPTEIFNLFNHYNPDVASVDLNIRSQTFGTIGGGVRGTTTRVIQLGAKLVF